MKFPFDDLNMCDAEHVEWVKSQRDPELWHAAAMAIINTIGDPHGQTDFLGEGLTGKQWLGAMEAMCRRAATVGFTNDSLVFIPGSRRSDKRASR